jgi:hypothetical protein
MLFKKVLDALKVVEIVQRDAGYNERVVRFFLPQSLSSHIGTNFHDY